MKRGGDLSKKKSRKKRARVSNVKPKDYSNDATVGEGHRGTE